MTPRAPRCSLCWQPMTYEFDRGLYHCPSQHVCAVEDRGRADSRAVRPLGNWMPSRPRDEHKRHAGAA